MTTEYTQEVIKKHGWTFVPSHDVEFITPGGKCVPESWVHDDHPTQWSIEDVLTFISKNLP